MLGIACNLNVGRTEPETGSFSEWQEAGLIQFGMAARITGLDSRFTLLTLFMGSLRNY